MIELSINVKHSSVDYRIGSVADTQIVRLGYHGKVARLPYKIVSLSKPYLTKRKSALLKPFISEV